MNTETCEAWFIIFTFLLLLKIYFSIFLILYPDYIFPSLYSCQVTPTSPSHQDPLITYIIPIKTLMQFFTEIKKKLKIHIETKRFRIISFNETLLMVLLLLVLELCYRITVTNRACYHHENKFTDQ